MPVIPSLQAMLLVDNHFKDEKTGKTNLTGIFDDIEINFPAREFTASAWVYLSLTDLLGSVNLVIRWIDLSSGEVLQVFGPAVVRSEDRLATLELTVPLPALPVPHSGSYAMELYSFDERVGSVRVTATVT